MSNRETQNHREYLRARLEQTYRENLHSDNFSDLDLNDQREDDIRATREEVHELTSAFSDAMINQQFDRAAVITSFVDMGNETTPNLVRAVLETMEEIFNTETGNSIHNALRTREDEPSNNADEEEPDASEEEPDDAEIRALARDCNLVPSFRQLQASAPGAASVIFAAVMVGFLRSDADFSTYTMNKPTQERLDKEFSAITEGWKIDELIDALNNVNNRKPEAESKIETGGDEPKNIILENLSNQTNFTYDGLVASITTSIIKHPESWKLNKLNTNETIRGLEEINIGERVAGRIWDFLKLLSGSTENTSIDLNNPNEASPTKKTLAEKQALLQSFLELHQDSITQLGSNFIGFEAFEEAQGEHEGALNIAIDLEKQVPWGLLVPTSGHRSYEDQLNIVKKLAKREKIDMSKVDWDNEDDTRAVVLQLRQNGLQIAMPGTSRHESDQALDITPHPELAEVSGKIEEVLLTNIDFKIIVERNNSATEGAPVFHVERVGDMKRVDNEPEALTKR